MYLCLSIKQLVKLSLKSRTRCGFCALDHRFTPSARVIDHTTSLLALLANIEMSGSGYMRRLLDKDSFAADGGPAAAGPRKGGPSAVRPRGLALRGALCAGSKNKNKKSKRQEHVLRAMHRVHRVHLWQRRRVRNLREQSEQARGDEAQCELVKGGGSWLVSIFFSSRLIEVPHSIRLAPLIWTESGPACQ